MAVKTMKIHSAIYAGGGGGARCYNGDRYEPGTVPGSTHMGNVG
jgi:hypothetical protein